MVDPEPRDLKDLKARKVTPVRLDRLDHQEMTENTAREDLLDPRGRRASLAFKEAPAPEAHQVWKDPRATPELPASLAILASRVRGGLRASLVTRVTMAERETEVSKGTPDPPASLDFKDLLESLECPDRLANKAMPDLQEQREILDLSDLQDCRGRLVTRDLPDLKDLPASEAIPAQLVRLVPRVCLASQALPANLECSDRKD